MAVMLEDTITLPIRPEGFTVDDLDQLPDGKIRYELIDGVLLVSPLGRQRHQLAISDLGDILKAACPHDLVVNLSGQDVRRGLYTTLEPDLLVVRLSDIELDSHVATAPLLVVEVVSPSSQRIDLGLKRDAYAEMGVPSYWVVHPAEDWVRVYGLRDESYELVAAADGDEVLEVTEPFPVSFRPIDLLARFRGNA